VNKVIVIGSGGAGKSTFSTQLGQKLGIEVIHLDQLYWRPDWTKTPADEWNATVADLVTRDSWVMDGNFGGTRTMRIAACDTVIFLDMPRLVCLYRVIGRLIKYRGRKRPDMADGCREKFDPEFLAWVWTYPKRARPRILDELASHSDKRIVILRSAREAEALLRDAA